MKAEFDFEIIEKDGKEAFWEVLDLRATIAENEKYPFLMGGENSRMLLAESYGFNRHSVWEIIEKARDSDVEKLFEKRMRDALPDAEEIEFDLAVLTGVWEPHDSNRDLGLPWDDFIAAHKDVSTKKFLDKCFVGIAPVRESWQVPAFVKFGAWNACPKPEEHCAIMRFWQEEYAAEIVSLTGDVIECAVKNPPQTEEECFRLAWQQYAYCSDIVDQGVGTVGALASRLRDCSYWYFWWD